MIPLDALLVVEFEGQKYLMDPSVLRNPFDVLAPQVMVDPYAGRIDPKRYLSGFGISLPINADVVMKLSPEPLMLDFASNIDPSAVRRTWHKRKRASKWLRRQRAAAPDAQP